MVSEKHSVRDELCSHYSGLMLFSFGTSIQLISHLITVHVTAHNEDTRTLKIAELDVME